jgi:2-dehydro-3-deoxygluconokinase
MIAAAFKPGRVISIGECMVELARGDDGRFTLACGGDTFNTAVYLARAGVGVDFATRLGDDPYSAGILDLARSENVGTALISVAKGRMPGLYMIETTGGERTFWYWRDRAPARELFDHPQAQAAIAAMRTAAAVYLSGVTLSLYGPGALDRFAVALMEARGAGTRIVMDSNYRPRGWGGDAARAREVFRRFWSLADIALPTFDDEAALWGDAEPAATVERLAALGVPEIVVKRGAEGALVAAGGVVAPAPCPAIVAPVDTTAAGDSFNAGYLAARIAGAAPRDAALTGHRLAQIVIQHRGAIVPRAVTQPLLG